MIEKDQDLVSVIIPTYNHGHFLKRALTSVINQSYINLDIVVIDNYSSDNTDEIVKGFLDPRIRFLKIKNNGVIAASRNLGIECARGKWLAFLDSDDWWDQKKIEKSLQWLKLNGGADIVYHDLYIASNCIQKYFFKKNITKEILRPVFDNLIKYGNCITLSSVVVNKKIFNDIGNFSEDSNLIAIEDFDAWIRLSRVTNKFQRIPQTLGFYWNGGGNTTNNLRSIEIISAIEARYSQQIKEFGAKKIWWLNYSRGHLCFTTKNYLLAIHYLRSLDFSSTPIWIWIKSFIILQAIYCIKKIEKFWRG